MGRPRYPWKLPSNLPECAKLEDLGNIASDMKVDGTPVAKLDVRQSSNPVSKLVESKINSLTNVTQSTSKVFTLTIPPDSVEIVNNTPGTWQAASDGWWVLHHYLLGNTLFLTMFVSPQQVP